MKAEYIDHIGDDLTVVNAARVSFNKESNWEDWPLNQKLSDKDTKLINYLTKHNHFTPFTHCVITMRETVPIFVARQRFKHTVGFSYNEVSRRYVDDEPEFFYPEYWRAKADDKKQGSSEEETIDSPIVDLGVKGLLYGYEDIIHFCEIWYKKAIEDGVAPEQARMVLPQSMYTSYYVTGSLAAWARAYNLRSDPHAQKEIQDLAKMWDTIIQPLYPVSWKALTNA